MGGGQVLDPLERLLTGPVADGLEPVERLAPLEQPAEVVEAHDRAAEAGHPEERAARPARRPARGPPTAPSSRLGPVPGAPGRARRATASRRAAPAAAADRTAPRRPPTAPPPASSGRRGRRTRRPSRSGPSIASSSHHSAASCVLERVDRPAVRTVAFRPADAASSAHGRPCRSASVGSAAWTTIDDGTRWGGSGLRAGPAGSRPDRAMPAGPTTWATTRDAPLARRRRDRDLGDAVERRGGRLDLARLEPHAADLHLPVDPAPVPEVPRRGPSRPGRRCGSGRRRTAPR